MASKHLIAPHPLSACARGVQLPCKQCKCRQSLFKDNCWAPAVWECRHEQHGVLCAPLLFSSLGLTDASHSFTLL